MKDVLKKSLQCRDCDMPYCDIPCDDLSDDTIDWIMKLTNQRVIEELEMILDRTKLAVNLESIRGHITSQIKLKQE